MMRLILAAVASAALSLTALSAAAQSPQPDLLQRFCIDTDGQAAPALAKADAEGWTALAKEAVPIPPSQGFSFDDYAVRLQSSKGAVNVLVVGHGTVTSASALAPADICLVVSKPSDAAAVARAKAWAGVDPLATQAAKGLAAYGFVDGPDGHKMLVADAAGQAAIKAGKVKMLLVMTPPNNDMSLVGFMRLHAVKDATAAVPSAEK